MEKLWVLKLLGSFNTKNVGQKRLALPYEHFELYPKAAMVGSKIKLEGKSF
jgi:hypothetical protein